MSNGVIALNFINMSADTNNSNIVIFQKNVAESFNEIAVAWRVIKNCGRLDNHPFNYPLEFDVSASDSYGNYTPQLTATNGDVFKVQRDNSGDVLQKTSQKASSPTEVEVLNSLEKGATNANCYRDGRLLASKTNIAPGQKAVFEFHPKIYIGVVSQIEEGDVMNSAILQSVNTELNLFGIDSADIVMTGGGSGESAGEFAFQLRTKS